MVTISQVKASELKRWLKKNGCSFVEESRHTRIVLGSGISRMPRHSEGSRFEDMRTEMEPYLALFEPDRKAGGFVVTFPDFGYGVTQGETDKEATGMARPADADHR